MYRKSLHQCALTGVHIDRDAAWVLDVRAARLALADLRRRVAQLDYLLSTLGAWQRVERTDQRGEVKVFHQRPVVSPEVVDRLALAWPNLTLFISLEAWIAERKSRTRGDQSHGQNRGAPRAQRTEPGHQPAPDGENAEHSSVREE